MLIIKSTILTLSLFLTLLNFNTSDIPRLQNTNQTIQEYAESFPNHDDYDFWTYQIIKINGNEIFGIPLDNISVNNQGVYLYQSEIEPILSIGNKVVVVFDKEYDDLIYDVKIIK